MTQKYPYIIQTIIIISGFIVILINRKRNTVLNYISITLIFFGILLLIIEYIYFIYITGISFEREIILLPELNTRDDISIISNNSSDDTIDMHEIIDLGPDIVYKKIESII